MTRLIEIAVWLFGRLEDDHVAATDVAPGQDGVLDGGHDRRKHHLVDDEVVTDEQIRLHGARRDLERLKHPRPDEQREDDGNDERLEVLARDGFDFLHSIFQLLASHFSLPTSVLPDLEHGEERLLRNLDSADALHPLLAFLLLLEQLSLA